MGDLISNQLQVEGVNCKGFGIIPKYVMIDNDLAIEAKTIYAYICSLAGNGKTVFPARDRILTDLQISKDAYYKYFRQLLDNGYIVVNQEKNTNGSFGKNIYTLISNPKKFEKKDDKDTNQTYSRIRFSGLKAMGFGIIPRAVMLDSRLPIKSKGIYAYFCSFTGSGNSAFPRKETILYHLGITEKTYYKFYTLLTGLNYITAVQRHIEGRLQVNDYYLMDMPNKDNAVKKVDIATKIQDCKNQDTADICTRIQDCKNQDTADTCTRIQDCKNQDTADTCTRIQDCRNQDTADMDNMIQDCRNQDTVKQDTVKQDTNINNLTINNSTINNPSLSLDSERKREEQIQADVEKELLSMRKLPYWYKTNEQYITAAIHFMSNWNTLYPKGYKDPLMQRVYNLFNEALIQMCTEEKMVLKGCQISYAKVIDKINQSAIFYENHIDISEFAEPAMDNFYNACVNFNIKNPIQYMKSCIWDAMLTGSIRMFAQLKQDVYY